MGCIQLSIMSIDGIIVGRMVLLVEFAAEDVGDEGADGHGGC